MAQTKTIQELKNASSKNAPYPQCAVKVKIVKVGHKAKFTGSNGEEMAILNFSVADETDTIMATLNDQKRMGQIVEGKSLHLRNFVLKNNKIVLTRLSKIMMCAPVNIPSSIHQQAIYLITPPSPKKKIAEIRTMPSKSVVTVVGEIVKDECIRKVKVGGEEADIHTIRLQEDGQEINVSLWREMSTFPLHVGQYVEVSQLLTGEWQGQAQLNSTRNTAITLVDIPEVTITGHVEGVSLGDVTVELALQAEDGNYHDLIVAKDVLAAALPGIEMDGNDESLEEALTNMLPISVNVTSKGSEIYTICLREESGMERLE